MTAPLLPLELHQRLCGAVSVLCAERPQADGDLRRAVDAYTEALRQVESGFALLGVFEPFAYHLLHTRQIGGHGKAIRALQERAAAWLAGAPESPPPESQGSQETAITEAPRRRRGRRRANAAEQV